MHSTIVLLFVIVWLKALIFLFEIYYLRNFMRMLININMCLDRLLPTMDMYIF